MALPAEKLPRYTFRDYLSWEGRWELIQGVPYAMTPLPSFRHQIISGRIHVELTRALKDCSLCVPLLPVDWKVDEYTVLQPDNLVFCGELPPEPPLTEPPVLIFEVLSPGTEAKDRGLKFGIYERAGVKYLVLVDPVKKEAEIYALSRGRYELFRRVQREKVGFDLSSYQIEIDFGRIFAGG